MPELDVTTSLLVAEVSEHLCISFIMRISCILCSVVGFLVFLVGFSFVYVGFLLSTSFHGIVASHHQMSQEYEEELWWGCT